MAATDYLKLNRRPALFRLNYRRVGGGTYLNGRKVIMPGTAVALGSWEEIWQG